MHFCCNVVCGEPGRASAVLLRAGAVLEGIETARSRRGSSTDRDLARGPARLCRALAIDRDANGTDLSVGPVTLELPTEPSPAVSSGPRVGLRHAADRPWRFWITDDPTVSRYVAAKPRRPRTR